MKKTASLLRVLLDEMSGIVKDIQSDELVRAKDEHRAPVPENVHATGRISSRLRLLDRSSSTACRTAVSPTRNDDSGGWLGRPSGALRRQYLGPGIPPIVIVGDRKTIEPSIRALNLGSITALSIDEVFAPAR